MGVDQSHPTRSKQLPLPGAPQPTAHPPVGSNTPTSYNNSGYESGPYNNSDYESEPYNNSGSDSGSGSGSGSGSVELIIFMVLMFILVIIIAIFVMKNGHQPVSSNVRFR